VSATLPLVGADGKLPVLVRNQLSNDATPLAVVFQPGLRREMGEAAIDTPASNAQNLVAAFVPRLGAPGEQVRGEEKKHNENENGQSWESRNENSRSRLRVLKSVACAVNSLSLSS
jgi:molecular chaperone DnaK (HSP70)